MHVAPWGGAFAPVCACVCVCECVCVGGACVCVYDLVGVFVVQRTLASMLGGLCGVCVCTHVGRVLQLNTGVERRSRGGWA